MASAVKILEHQDRLSANFGSEPLLVHPDGRIINLATGYIPLSSTFTTEDKAAKGLRKGKETFSQPVYFTLLDLVRDNRILLLRGPSGSGKSTFAKHFCFSLARLESIALDSAISHGGSTENRQYDLTGLRPCYFAIKGPAELEALAQHTIPTLLAELPAPDLTGLLVVVDAIENAGRDSAMQIESIVAQLSASSNTHHRLLFLGDTSASDNLAIPFGVIKHNIKPLSSTNRRQAVSRLTGVDLQTVDCALGDATSNPALFALALQAKHQADQPEALLDAWLDTIAGTGVSVPCIEQDAFLQMCQNVCHAPKPELEVECLGIKSPFLAQSRKVQHLLAARYLSHRPADIAVGLYKHDPILTADIIKSLLTRLLAASSEGFDGLTQALLQKGDTTSHRAALLVARAGKTPVTLQSQICCAALAILEEGKLSLSERQDAASILSRFEDPRDLTALVEVPASSVTLGSNTHPNSQPMHTLLTGAFRIAVFPVTIQQYAKFIAATRRQWASPDQQDICKRNFPATDVAWHDAVAYCEWLTLCWRADGLIGEDEKVRLPTEPEWEKAARAGLDDSDPNDCIWPWGTEWKSDASNSEETGLNQPCAVGLFPKGVSMYGCHDMAGNIWEWCTTLWGEDMTTPSFCYPWQDDGREAVEATPALRRVLRGGCFSSGRVKANCTYRGSLEPSGYWRGNGFRVVVARC